MAALIASLRSTILMYFLLAALGQGTGPGGERRRGRRRLQRFARGAEGVRGRRRQRCCAHVKRQRRRSWMTERASWMTERAFTSMIVQRWTDEACWNYA